MNQESKEKEFTFSVNEREITAILEFAQKKMSSNGIHKDIEFIDIRNSEDLVSVLKYAGALKSSSQVLFGPAFFELPDDQKLFAVYHEVGHLFLDHNGETRSLEQELEADTFSLSKTKNVTAAIDFFNFIIKNNLSNDEGEIQSRIQNAYDFQKDSLKALPASSHK